MSHTMRQMFSDCNVLELLIFSEKLTDQAMLEYSRLDCGHVMSMLAVSDPLNQALVSFGLVCAYVSCFLAWFMMVV